MVYKTNLEREFHTHERCFIIEIMNNDDQRDLSIARARVQPGITTQLHSLASDEYYYILEGKGIVEVNESFTQEVVPGDVIPIKAGVSQRITNNSNTDLIFLCICQPRFQQDNYKTLE